MFGIGETELFIILLFGFMLFGPDKLPGMGRTIGRALRQFRSAQEGFTKVVQTEVIDPATEAMNMSTTKPNRDRASEIDDEDADIDLPEGEGASRKKPTETFAERKARLAAERKAREEAAAAEEEAKAAAAEGGDETSSDGEPGDEASEEPQVEATAVQETTNTEDAEEEPSTVNDLYALSTRRRKSSRRKAAEEKAAAEAEAAAAEAAAEAAADENPTEDAGDDGAPEAEASAPAIDTTEDAGDDGAPEAEASAPVQPTDSVDEQADAAEENLGEQSAAAEAAKPLAENSSAAIDEVATPDTGEEDGSNEA